MINKINENMNSINDNITETIKTTKVLSEPIDIDGEIIIPINNVTVFQLFGGGEYGKIKLFNKNKNFPYSIGDGSVINIKPTSFLIKNKSGVFNIYNAKNDNFENILKEILKYIK